MPFSCLLIRSAALGEDPRKWPFVLCLFIFAPCYTCLCLSVLACAWCVFPLLFEHLRASSVTERKHSHTVSSMNHEQILCVQKHTLVATAWRNPCSASKACQRSFSCFFQTCQHVFFLCACSILSGLGPQLLISEHVQGGPLLIKRPRLNASGSPGHCPINQIVNVIRRMWDVAATGQMKHAEEGLLSCRLGSSGR